MTKKQKTTDKEFAETAAKIAIELNCTDVAVFDLRDISPATNFFVIATGTSDRQGRTVADEISAVGKKSDFPLFGRAGYNTGKWILLDFVEVVVHIFSAEYRDYYNLDMLWGDAKKLKID